MRFGKCRGLFAAAALALVWTVPAGATDITIPGKIGMVKPGLFKIVAKPVGAFTIPGVGSGGDPLINAGDVHVFDTDGSGDLFDSLTGGVWSGLGNPPGQTGYKYKNTVAPTGGDVKIVILKPTVIKILAKGTGSLTAPIGLNLGVELITGTDKRCAEFGGTTIRNQGVPSPLFKRKDAPAPASCALVAASCCGTPSATHLRFSTITSAGDCGDVLDATGMVVSNVNCAGLYTGGGGNSVPLPYAIPDLGNSVTAVTGCAADVVTVGGTSSTATGSNRTCTNPGCFYGAPLSVPNPVSTPTSACVVNEVATAPSGTMNCATGATSMNLPLSAEIFLTGDKDLGSGGIQPCPQCISGMCTTGANAGGTCVAGTTAIDVGYPTSHGCPPDGSNSIGNLPIVFTLTSGTVTWTGTTATNDSGSTASSQTRVFSGFCRDVALPGGTGSFDAGAAPGNQFQHCWENGMAVNGMCDETLNGAESCEQRTQGAFGPNGGANRTIRAIGNAMSITAGPAPATLVGVFTIPPTFDATIDGAGDLPGPGAVAIPGSAGTCTTANPCP